MVGTSPNPDHPRIVATAVSMIRRGGYTANSEVSEDDKKLLRGLIVEAYNSSRANLKTKLHKILNAAFQAHQVALVFERLVNTYGEERGEFRNAVEDEAAQLQKTGTQLSSYKDLDWVRKQAFIAYYRHCHAGPCPKASTRVSEAWQRAVDSSFKAKVNKRQAAYRRKLREQQAANMAATVPKAPVAFMKGELVLNYLVLLATVTSSLLFSLLSISFDPLCRVAGELYVQVCWRLHCPLPPE